jgi:hypothetical protein
MMSYKLVKHVVDEIRDITPTEKLVMLVVASHRNEETGRCFPSQSLVAEKSGLTDRTVRRSLTSLEEKGLISRAKQTGKSDEIFFPTTPDTETATPDTVSAYPGRSFLPPRTQCPTNREGNIEINKEGNKGNKEVNIEAPKKVTSKTRMPKDWKPSLETVGRLKDLGYTEQQINHEAYSCREYFSPLALRRPGWERTFVAWMERSNHQPREKYTPPKKQLPKQYYSAYFKLMRGGKETPESKKFLEKYSV